MNALWQVKGGHVSAAEIRQGVRWDPEVSGVEWLKRRLGLDHTGPLCPC